MNSPQKLSRDSSPEPEDRSRTMDADLEKTLSETAAPKAPEKSKTEDFGPPPDGGLEAWSVVLGGFFTVFASFGWINCIGVFQNYYEQNQLKAYSPSTIAWIPSTESFMLFFFGPVAGKLTDQYGPRIPILLGSFLHVFGLMMTSISSEYYQIFLAQSICSAIGCSFLFYATVAAAGSWFSRHRALAFGIITAGSSLGGVIMPIMVERLIQEAGFGWAMRGIAFLILGILIIGNLTVKARLSPLRRGFKLKDFIAPFSEPPFLVLTIGSFFIYVGGFLPFNFLIAQATANGMSTELAGYLIPILNAASTFGRIVPAHFGDTYGVFNMMIVHTLLAGVFNLAVWLPANSNATRIVFAVLYGYFSGCTLSIIPAMVAKLSDPRHLGVRSGSLYGVSSIGVLIGSPIAGAIVNAQGGGYSGLIIFCGIMLLVGTVFATISRNMLVGWKLMAKF